MLEDKTLNELEEVFRSSENVLAAYVYGSHAEGTEHKDSDIDIGILVDEKEFGTDQESALFRQLSSVLEPEVDLRVFNGRDVRFLHNALSDAVVIYEGDAEERRKFEENVLKEFLDMKPFYDEYDEYVRERVTG